MRMKRSMCFASGVIGQVLLDYCMYIFTVVCRSKPSQQRGECANYRVFPAVPAEMTKKSVTSSRGSCRPRRLLLQRHLLETPLWQSMLPHSAHNQLPGIFYKTFCFSTKHEIRQVLCISIKSLENIHFRSVTSADSKHQLRNSFHCPRRSDKGLFYFVILLTTICSDIVPIVRS